MQYIPRSDPHTDLLTEFVTREEWVRQQHGIVKQALSVLFTEEKLRSTKPRQSCVDLSLILYAYVETSMSFVSTMSRELNTSVATYTKGLIVSMALVILSVIIPRHDKASVLILLHR